MRARLFGQKLIFDCSFDESMTRQEVQSAGRQLHYCYGNNRRLKDPFDMHLCNVNMRGGTMHWLQRHMPNILEKNCLFPVHEKCSTELFPLERLVYLSPDSNNVLTNYNFDDIFIVGAIVDKGPCQHLSLAKAKSLGVRHARLPLDEYVRIKSGVSKRFSFLTMLNILHEWKQTQDWKKAFERISKEKLAEPTE